MIHLGVVLAIKQLAGIDFPVSEFHIGVMTTNSKLTDYYKEHAAMLLRKIRRRGVPSFAVEEVAESVWLKAFESYSTFEDRNPGAFRSWICKIAENGACDWLRKKSNHQQSLPPDYDPHDPKIQSPEAIVLERERHAALQDCIGRLDDKKRGIVRDRLQGLSSRETAERCELGANHVDRQFHEAKKQLKECMEEKFQDHDKEWQS